MKSSKIGNNTLVSDFLLPGNNEIISLFLDTRLSITALPFKSFSIKGCPTNVFFIFSSSKYFFSKLNNKSI